jgi:hypothetical protein
MKVEMLYFGGCPNHEALLPRLRALMAAAGVVGEVELVRIADADEAQRQRFLGSPSVRVDGEDIEPGASKRTDFGLKCRLFATPSGLHGIPPDEWVEDALHRVLTAR